MPYYKKIGGNIPQKPKENKKLLDYFEKHFSKSGKSLKEIAKGLEISEDKLKTTILTADPANYFKKLSSVCRFDFTDAHAARQAGLEEIKQAEEEEKCKVSIADKRLVTPEEEKKKDTDSFKKWRASRMKEHALTDSHIAMQLDISESTWKTTYLYNPESIPHDKVVKICELFRVRPAEFCKEAGINKS